MSKQFQAAQIFAELGGQAVIFASIMRRLANGESVSDAEFTMAKVGLRARLAAASADPGALAAVPPKDSPPADGSDA